MTTTPTTRHVNIRAGTHTGLTFLLRGVGGVYRPEGVALAAAFFGVVRPPLALAPFAMGRG